MFVYLQVYPCPEPIPCYQPVLPRCNPQCPPPILPKQRPICPRAPPAPYPCLPVCRSCCPHCELDPVTRRRPLIVHDSVFKTRKSGLPAECYKRSDPSVRYGIENYVRQVRSLHVTVAFKGMYIPSLYYFQYYLRLAIGA